MNQIAFLLSRARPYWRQLVFLGALAASQSISALAIPWLGGSILGAIAVGRGMPAGGIIVLLVLALAAMALFAAFTAYQSARVAAVILADLRREIYAHIIALPVSFHDRQRQGELLSLMTYEVSSLGTFLTSTLAPMPAMLLTAAGAMVALIFIDPVLGITVPVLIPLFAIGVRLAGRRIRHVAHESRRAEVSVIAEAESQLGLIPAIKAFAAESTQATRYETRVAAALRRRNELALVSSAIGPAIWFAAGCTAIVVLGVSGGKVASGSMGSADLFRFLLYAALLTRPVTALGGVYGAFQTARGALRDLGRLLRQPPESGLAESRVMPPVTGMIEFSSVDFTYEGREPVLTGASFAISPGETVAFVGPNGAGKSTVISLLLRFYEPAAGRIAIDGIPIDAVSVQSLRRQIGFVPQRPLMFNGTVRENLVFGAPDADQAAIASALTLAQANQFVAELPQGLDTLIGDHGILLSGGQRQRIALARALVPDPPVLVFDEATSMIDLEGEADFVSACRTALVGRTVIIVTHRPATLALADRVFEVADGTVREIAASVR